MSESSFPLHAGHCGVSSVSATGQADSSGCPEDEMFTSQSSSSLLLTDAPSVLHTNLYDAAGSSKLLEDFMFEGSPSAFMGTARCKGRRKREVGKRMRNLGLPYVSVKSQRVNKERRVLGPRCDGKYCDFRGNACSLLSEDRRFSLLTDFWDLGDLHEQRKWVFSHILWVNNALDEKNPNKRQKKMIYLLPFEDEKKPVCKNIFLSTLSISERFVRTVISKSHENGVIEKDKRGGRFQAQKERDAKKWQAVEAHIDQFAGVHSSGYKSSSSSEHGAHKLSVSKMYKLYKSQYGKDTPVSHTFYFNVFRQKYQSTMSLTEPQDANPNEPSDVDNSTIESSSSVELSCLPSGPAAQQSDPSESMERARSSIQSSLSVALSDAFAMPAAQHANSSESTNEERTALQSSSSGALFGAASSTLRQHANPCEDQEDQTPQSSSNETLFGASSVSATELVNPFEGTDEEKPMLQSSSCVNFSDASSMCKTEYHTPSEFLDEEKPTLQSSSTVNFSVASSMCVTAQANPIEGKDEEKPTGTLQSCSSVTVCSVSSSMPATQHGSPTDCTDEKKPKLQSSSSVNCSDASSIFETEDSNLSEFSDEDKPTLQSFSSMNFSDVSSVCASEDSNPNEFSDEEKPAAQSSPSMVLSCASSVQPTLDSLDPGPSELSEGHLINDPPSTFAGVKGNSLKQTRKERKKMRNLGLPYVTEKSQRVNKERRVLGPRCDGKNCKFRGNACSLLSEDRRLRLITDFWNLGDLHKQRKWVFSHILWVNNALDEKNPRKWQKKMIYLLPFEDEKKPVCKNLFLSTLSITERFVRTVVSKSLENGVLQREKRGGRIQTLKERDAKKRQAVVAHINQFPTMQSNSSRSSFSLEHIVRELNVSKMYKLYQSEYGQETPVSSAFYRKVFHEINVHGHGPEKNIHVKDEIQGRDEDSEENFSCLGQSQKQIAEKEEVEEILKESSDESKRNSLVITAVFDLEKVVDLPKSQREEDLCKENGLSCYNLTIYEPGTCQGHCFFWHEGQAGNGPNEIASCVEMFLRNVDAKGATHVRLFSDGCGGQNIMGSILASVFSFVLNSALSLQLISYCFFDTSYDQSVGGSMCDIVGETVKQVPDIVVPAEVVGILKLASKEKPYTVTEISTRDVNDWEHFSSACGVVQMKTSENDVPVQWEDVMLIEVSRSDPDKIMFKTSHQESTFDAISLTQSAASVAAPCSTKAYRGPPKLTASKYAVLTALCRGPTPRISHPDQQRFYRNLPH